MAIVKCYECGNKVSTKASTCPSCGAPVKKRTGKAKKVFLLTILFWIVLVFGVMPLISNFSKIETRSGQPDSEDIREEIMQKAKLKWEAEIQSKYQDLVTAYEGGDKEMSMELLNQFKAHDDFDYKDVSEIYRFTRTEILSTKLDGTGEDDYKTLYEIYREFSQLYPDNLEYREYAAKCKKAYDEAESYRKELEKIQQQKRMAAQNRQRNIEDQFSSWDGSHRLFTRIIKDNMHDPSSYKHVETKYGDYDSYIYVTTKFRGTNAFGAVVTNTMAAKFTIDGRLIEIIE